LLIKWKKDDKVQDISGLIAMQSSTQKNSLNSQNNYPNKLEQQWSRVCANSGWTLDMACGWMLMMEDNVSHCL